MHSISSSLARAGAGGSRRRGDRSSMQGPCAPATEWGEQEPGPGGKDPAAAFVKLLAGFPVYTEPTTGSKETACDPLASQAEAGNVRVRRASWSSAFIAEACDFPSGKYDDQIESAARAFNKLTRHPTAASGTNREPRR